MNIEQIKKKLDQLLEKLKKDLPLAERISTVEEIEEIIKVLVP